MATALAFGSGIWDIGAWPESKSSTWPTRFSSPWHRVFLLSGVGVVLGVLIARLARIVDRARAAEDRVRNDCAHDTPETRAQLRVLARRARLINIAITLITITALLVALVIALLFASTFAPMNLATPVAVLFVLSMVSLVVALVAFLLEVRIAIAVLRIGSW